MSALTALSFASFTASLRIYISIESGLQGPTIFLIPGRDRSRLPMDRKGAVAGRLSHSITSLLLLWNPRGSSPLRKHIRRTIMIRTEP